ncbi:regulator of chromosome condensation 1/beta-lactamase-inhibitor protein II [Baffinella frigidus]|nr:regulator of chromosome condensation 1/beta-lactamase-inhibitor protein II [Cryptophyta sp. CCMP2293]
MTQSHAGEGSPSCWKCPPATYSPTIAATSVSFCTPCRDQLTSPLGSTDVSACLPVAPPCGLAVSLGNDFSCAVKTVGEVMCWGLNNYGQLGNGTTTNEHSPVLVAGLTNWVKAVSAGLRFACSLQLWGKIQCWGDNGVGQLGLGNNFPASTSSATEPVHLWGNAVALSSTYGDTICAILENGDVYCWGAGSNGARIAAETGTGGVKCWGEGSYGKLGSGSTANIYSPPDDEIVLGAGRSARQITCGENFCCVVLDTSEVKCWGQNNYGQLGTGDTVPPVNSSRGDLAGANVTDISVLDDANLRCWGKNTYGELGEGNTVDRPHLAVTRPLPRPVAIHAPVCNEQSCNASDELAEVLRRLDPDNWIIEDDDGSVDDDDEDDDDPEDATQLLPCPPGETISDPAARLSCACADCINGTYKNTSGVAPCSPCPAGTSSPAGSVNVWLRELDVGGTAEKIATDNNFGCAVLMHLPAVDLNATAAYLPAVDLNGKALSEGGLVKCWGYNGWGQLGYQDTRQRGDGGGEMGVYLPAVDLVEKAIAVSAGYYHSCALLRASSPMTYLPAVDLNGNATANGGVVKCWGYNGYGQLGYQDTRQRGDVRSEMGVSRPPFDSHLSWVVLEMPCSVLEKS